MDVQRHIVPIGGWPAVIPQNSEVFSLEEIGEVLVEEVRPVAGIRAVQHNNTSPDPAGRQRQRCR